MVSLMRVRSARLSVLKAIHPALPHLLPSKLQLHLSLPFNPRLWPRPCNRHRLRRHRPTRRQLHVAPPLQLPRQSSSQHALLQISLHLLLKRLRLRHRRLRLLRLRHLLLPRLKPKLLAPSLLKRLLRLNSLFAQLLSSNRLPSLMRLPLPPPRRRKRLLPPKLTLRQQWLRPKRRHQNFVGQPVARSSRVLKLASQKAFPSPCRKALL